LSGGNTSVFLDAGDWQTPADITGLLVQAGVAQDAGFSLNVSESATTASAQSYGDEVVADLDADGVGGKHYVVDTSRNGNGMAGNPAGYWCNLPDLALGADPTTVTSDPLDAAYLWVKYPGESDGTCSGDGTYDAAAPPSGTFWLSYAVGLANGDS
jgi:endoglucanase